MNNLQYICDDTGQTLAVVVPIQVWQDLMADNETAYLLSSDAMKQRLFAAKNPTTGISLDAAREKLGI
ncbi:hypothetical protein [Picosynechococcus sp. PCC 7003]|uniref:hypothetical protein n=1 Tax=Picosynechococcus sp. PCC 7003 TaxID=374981 RepID=UPI001E5D353D|nr:hypothetical protein [Picosynechococcus sp. PCC 7003]